MMNFKKLFLIVLLLFLPCISPALSQEQTEYKVAIFAGGCFWCMEPPFERVNGVKSVVSGYSGGHKINPAYKDVSQGTTGHYEVVEITYDPDRVTFNELLSIFWRNIDPFDQTGQFCDKGQQYKSVIFYKDEFEKNLAMRSKKELEEYFNKPIHTLILPMSDFYKAEEYHQDYYKKNKLRYKFYRGGCGRDKKLEEIWGEEAGGYHILTGD